MVASPSSTAPSPTAPTGSSQQRLEVSTPEVQPSYRSIGEMLLARVEATPDADAYRFPAGDGWGTLSWKQALERVRAIASGLHSLGLESEQRVGILSSTRVEWVLADLGVLCAGGATTTVYPSCTAEESSFILSDSDSVFLFAEDQEQVEKIRSQREELPRLAMVITFDGAGDDEWVMTLSDLEDLGRRWHEAHPGAFEEQLATVEPEHLATLIYTSGTTGKPKGVRLVHECWTYEAEAIERAELVGPDDLQYLWLPLSHSFGKVLEVAQIQIGFPTAIDGRVDRLVDNLAVVRPTFMAAAPRIFEKVYNKIVRGSRESRLKQAIFDWAVGVGQRVSRLRQQGEEPSGLLSLRSTVADKLVFSKLKGLFGGRLRFFISGSAPLSREIAEFFHAVGVLILEGYGLTETSAASFVNRLDSYRFGTVGLPFPGTQLRISPDDGEILIKGPGVMRGYHGLPEQTAEVLVDGWLHTGDIGEIDEHGLLRITDRKKDLIKTSAGKYVAPQYLEGRFKATCPYVSQVLVHGDRRNFCTALITLDEEAMQAWARSQGLGEIAYQELATHPEVVRMVSDYVEELNAGLATYETIKRFRLLPRDLSVEAGDLTPSLKVKRRVVEGRFGNLLDEMYQGAVETV